MGDILSTTTAILVIALMNAAAICGLWLAGQGTDDKGRKMILVPVRELADKLLGTYWSKPVLGCYKCMGSLWAGVPALVILLVNLDTWESWQTAGAFGVAVGYACMVSYFSTLMVAVLDYLEEK